MSRHTRWRSGAKMEAQGAARPIDSGETREPSWRKRFAGVERPVNIKVIRSGLRSFLLY